MFKRSDRLKSYFSSTSKIIYSQSDLWLKLDFVPNRLIILLGFAIRMLMLAVVKSALLNLFYSCTRYCIMWLTLLVVLGRDCGLCASPMMHNLSLPIYKWVVVPVVGVFFGSCLLCNNLVDDRILTTNLIYWSTVFFLLIMYALKLWEQDSCCRCNCYDVFNFGSYLRSLHALEHILHCYQITMSIFVLYYTSLPLAELVL